MPINRKEPDEIYFFIELNTFEATVLHAWERKPSYPTFAGARLAAGNYFHTLEEAQLFADRLNKTLKDRII